MKKTAPDNFCILPFTTVLVRADASVSVCCMNSSSVQNEKKEPFHLYKDPMKTAFQSKFFHELRQDMREGKRHPSCQSCWQDDDAGARSKRVGDNEILHHWVEKSLAGNGPDAPIDISFNLGTLCNLKCRICGSTSSSRWAQEYLELFGTDHIPRNNDYIKKVSLEESRALLSNWPQKSPEVTSTVFEWLPHIERLEFLGGEPFLNLKQFEIVAKAVEIGAAKNQTLHFVTNSTLYPEAAIRDHWPHFKSINVNISVDGLGKQFEYQRFGANWENALTNIQKYRASEHVDLVQIYVSISVFTVFYLPEILAFWGERGLKVCFSFVTNPHRFDVRVLPPSVKESIAKKFAQAAAAGSQEIVEKLQQVSQFMNSADHSENWLKFIESVWFHDDYRKQNFAEYFPEFHAEISKLGHWHDYVSEKDLFLQAGQEKIGPATPDAHLEKSIPANARKPWYARFIGNDSDVL